MEICQHHIDYRCLSVPRTCSGRHGDRQHCEEHLERTNRRLLARPRHRTNGQQNIIGPRSAGYTPCSIYVSQRARNLALLLWSAQLYCFHALLAGSTALHWLVHCTNNKNEGLSSAPCLHSSAAPRRATLRCSALRCFALLCASLHCTALHCAAALLCSALAMLCSALAMLCSELLCTAPRHYTVHRNVRASIDPSRCDMPCARAGLTVYLAR